MNRRYTAGTLLFFTLASAQAVLGATDQPGRLDATTKFKTFYNPLFDRYIRKNGIDGEACWNEPGAGIQCLSTDRKTRVAIGDDHEKGFAGDFWICTQLGVEGVDDCVTPLAAYSCGDTYCSCSSFDDCVALGQSGKCDYNPFDDCWGSGPTCGCCTGCE
ncbi:MAG: hypothetical protein AAGA56_09200 [Myxococcota bacterium]